MKRIVSIVLTLVMLLGMIPMSLMNVSAVNTDKATATAEVSGVTGTGIFEDPYVVTNGEQLISLINTREDMYIRIDANISLDKTLYINSDIYINLNAKNITSTGEYGIFNIKSSGMLTMYGSGNITYSGPYYAIFVAGEFETSGAITYEMKNESYALICTHEYGIVRIYDGVFKGGQIDNNVAGQILIYGGTIEKVIFTGPSALTAIYGSTFYGRFGAQGKVYIYDGEFKETVNAYYNGVITIYAGHFKTGIATPEATGTHKMGDNSYCISHKNKSVDDTNLYVYEEVTVYSPAFAEQSPYANGKTEIDGGTIHQYESYTVGFKAKDVPEIFAEAGFAIEEKLIVKDSAGNTEYSESNKGTTARGIYYNLQELDGGDYTVERIINLYRDGSVVETKQDKVKVKVNPLSSSDFGFKTMTPSVNEEDMEDKYTELEDKEIGTSNITFGFTSQLSQELVDKGYSVKEKINITYNNQGTIKTLNSGANFNLMNYVDRVGDYQVWFSLSLYRGNEYVTSIGHIYNITIVPNAVTTLKANVVAPKAGALPDETVTPAGEGYKTTDVDWSYYDETADEYYIMPDGMKFEAGKTYECAVQFEALDEYIFADDKAHMAGFINGYKGVISPVYSNKKAYVIVNFTIPEEDTLTVIFTPDSKPVVGNKLTVDIEAMAEKDDELMDAYFNDDITYKWFYDGRLKSISKIPTFEIKPDMLGHYIAVKVVYGDKSVASEEFEITKSSVLLGDANGDGEVNIVDATYVQLYVAKYKVEDINLTNADVNQDGLISIQDATAIQMFVTKMISSFDNI